MRLIFNLLSFLAYLYQIVLVLYFILAFVKPAQSSFTQFLNRIVEPVLVPLRRLLAKILPANWQRLDWSPVAAWVLLWFIRELLTQLRLLFA